MHLFKSVCPCKAIAKFDWSMKRRKTNIIDYTFFFNGKLYYIYIYIYRGLNSKYYTNKK